MSAVIACVIGGFAGSVICAEWMAFKDSRWRLGWFDWLWRLLP